MANQCMPLGKAGGMETDIPTATSRAESEPGTYITPETEPGTYITLETSLVYLQACPPSLSVMRAFNLRKAPAGPSVGAAAAMSQAVNGAGLSVTKPTPSDTEGGADAIVWSSQMWDSLNWT